MSYAVVMVDAEPDEGSEARLRLAAGLADRFGAALIGLASREVIPAPITPPALGGAAAVELFEPEQQRVEAVLRAAHERFRAVVGKEGRRQSSRGSTTRRAGTSPGGAA